MRYLVNFYLKEEGFYRKLHDERSNENAHIIYIDPLAFLHWSLCAMLHP